jgi:DNA-directed RNA polymerase I, II, and III subunit RPABC2
VNSKASVKEKKRRVSKKVVRKEEKVEEEVKIFVGPPKLTRFERARIIGARALQLSLGAPPFIPIPTTVKSPIELAIVELEAKALPISIRRTLPNGQYQDIPINWLL